MNAGYSYPARFYDELMSHADYPAWARFIDRAVGRFGRGATRTVLDLACGTGALSEVLAEAGYDLTCVDASPEMLAGAREKLCRFTDPAALIVAGDMRSFELNDVVDCTVCALGSLNYLTGRGDLDACFRRVHLFSRPDALFLFDVDAPRKLETVYASDHVLEAPGLLCTWQTEKHSSGLCEFFLSFFEEQPDGSYLRFDEYERERVYSRRRIEGALNRAGFELCGVFSGEPFDSLAPATDQDERLMFAARAIK